MSTLIDTGEEHHAGALIFGLILLGTDHVLVGVRRFVLMDTAVGRLLVLEDRAPVRADLIFGGKSRPVEEGRRAVLLTSEVVAEGEGISGGILVHRRICHSTHQDHSIGGEAHSDSHEAHLYGMHRTGCEALVPIEEGADRTCDQEGYDTISDEW